MRGPKTERGIFLPIRSGLTGVDEAMDPRISPLRSAAGFLIALPGALGLVLVLLLAVDPAPSKAGFKTGISVFSASVSNEFATEAQRIRKVGSTYVLYWLRWDLVAPSVRPGSWDPTDPSEPAYDWSTIDQRVVEARKAGLNPILQIWGAPKWAQGCSPSEGVNALNSAPCNPEIRALTDFSEAASRRFSGGFEGLPRVKYWQVLNEPNLHVFFNPQFNKRGRPVSPAIYRKILDATYPVIKSVHRSNVVLAAGLAPNGVAGSISPMDFTRRLLCMNKANRPMKSPNACSGKVSFDVFDMHPYTSGGPTNKARHEGNVQMGNLGELKALLAAADKAKRIYGMFKRTPLWITEMSWDSRPPDPGGVEMRILKRWTSEVLYRAWKAGVRTFLWYSLRDQPKGDLPWSDTTQSGLYFRGETIEQDRPKPSLLAFHFPAVAYSRSKGMTFWGRTPESSRGWVSIQMRRPRVKKHQRRWVRLGRARANSTGVFRGFIRSRSASRKRGMIRMVHRGKSSVPFSLKPVRNRYQRPFG